jgi:ribosomal RNA-processing protein 12
MVIDESKSEGPFPKAAATDVAGTAYRECITSVDGFTRGPKGQVKFNNDTKKRRRDNADIGEDVEMMDGDTGSGKGKNKRRSDIKLGHEFKAKVKSSALVRLYILLNDCVITEGGRRCEKGGC